MIYAVDFDFTLCNSNYPELGEPIHSVMDFCKHKQKEGHKLILWTCRSNEYLKQAVEWCEGNGLIFDAVNDNLPELNEKYGNNSRKGFRGLLHRRQEFEHFKFNIRSVITWSI